MFNTSTSVENDTASYHNNALERGTLWLIGVANGGATSDQLRKQLTFLVAVSLVALVGIVIDAGLHSSFTTPMELERVTKGNGDDQDEEEIF